MNEEKNGLNNQTNSVNVTSRIVKPIPIENSPQESEKKQQSSEKEVGTVIVGKPMSNIIKPIPVGAVGGFAPQATIGGEEIKPPKKENNIVVIIVLILVIIGLFGYLLWNYLLKDMVGNNKLSGSIISNNLVYSKVKKGDKISFKSSNDLTLVVDVLDLQVQDNNVGTKVIYTIREENGKEVLNLPYSWLTDDGSLKIPVTIVGNTAIFSYQNDDSLEELAFISADGSINKVNDYNDVLKEEKGLYIDSFRVNGVVLEVSVSRLIGDSIIKYGSLKDEFDNSIDDEEQFEKYMRYSSGDGVSICLDDAKKIPENTTVKAVVSYSIKDNVLDLKNPLVSDKEEYSKFLNDNSSILCQ